MDINIKEKSKKYLTVVIIILATCIILYVILQLILNTSNSLNQGNFRINDFVIMSTLDVNDNQNSDTQLPNTLSDIKLNISQKNKLSILVATNAASQAKSIYIDNISYKAPALKGDLVIKQVGEYTTNKLEDKPKEVNIYSEIQDLQYLVELEINNNNCIVDATLPENTNSAVFDGTLLTILSKRLDDVVFTISFNLNIIDNLNKTNTCKIKLKLPYDELISKGVSITREKPSDYVFKLK